MKKNKFKNKREEKSNSPFENKRKFCPFSQPNSPKIDYKDIRLLSRYITEKGKIIKDLNKELNQSENLLRHIFIKVNEHQELPTILNYEKK